MCMCTYVCVWGWGSVVQGWKWSLHVYMYIMSIMHVYVCVYWWVGLVEPCYQ